MDREKVGLLGDRLSEIDKQVIRCVNDNLKSIIRVLLDLLDYNNGFTASDFLPELLERMLVVYLRSPKFFADFFPDKDLNNYYEFKPKDLQEQFDDMQKLLN